MNEIERFETLEKRLYFDNGTANYRYKYNINSRSLKGSYAGHFNGTTGYRCLSFRKGVKVFYVLQHRFTWWRSNNYPRDMPKEVDHIDRNKLNNFSKNLRASTHRDNSCNVSKWKKPTSSKYVGVSYDKRRSKWQAYCTVQGRRHSLGLHETEELAKDSRNKFISSLSTFYNKQ